MSLENIIFSVDSFSVDPPEAPEQDKQVRNLTYQIVAMNSDYTFNFIVTWVPPVYPHKVIYGYLLSWQKFTQSMPFGLPTGNRGFTAVSRDLMHNLTLACGRPGSPGLLEMEWHWTARAERM